MMYGIGIDMSLLHTGCVVIDEKLRVKEHCLIEPKSKGYPRVLEIIDGVRNFIEHAKVIQWVYELSGGGVSTKTSIDGIVAIEDYVIGRGFKTGMDVLKAQGGVVAMLWDFHMPCYLVHPARLKHFQIHGQPIVEEILVIASDLSRLSEHEAVTLLSSQSTLPSFAILFTFPN